MLYLLLKALHVTAVITWIGGMLTVAIMLACCRIKPSQEMSWWLDGLRAWDRRVTTPAMLLAWVLGLGLASMGHWFPQGWLLVKLVLVLMLSGVHGMLVGKLRNWSADPAETVLSGRFTVPAGIIIATAIITVLVILKPHAY